MCRAGVTYWVKYKGIKVPIVLKNHCTTLGQPDFIMLIGQKEVGRHWCVHCRVRTINFMGKSIKGFYQTHADCIGENNHKITRAINILEQGASKKRGQALRQVFLTHFGVKTK